LIDEKGEPTANLVQLEGERYQTIQFLEHFYRNLAKSNPQGLSDEEKAIYLLRQYLPDEEQE
jgi:hypothetical protein